MEHLLEWELAGEIEILEGNLSQWYYLPPRILHNLTWGRTLAAAVESRRTNHLNYGTASYRNLI
jgi:hypothetical protein